MRTDWWIPGKAVGELMFGAFPSDSGAFQKRHVVDLISNDLNGKKNYDAIDGSYTLIMDEAGISSVCFYKEFFVNAENIIGASTEHALEVIGKHHADRSLVISYDNWVEIEENVVARDVDIDELCIFLTENDDGKLISVSVYG